ncbi:hypothetical protein MCANPG14_02356 [Mycoplasmopsis canis PG 14]|uniref:SMODS and SLOG-associating 2TM effector domain-containing protein n=1 Tax=Mycoplasmopsis canis TaxID=29555 RepID=A0A449AQS4_9BACT|nr:SLATT domain-containing protein [Mycoplasmopsis canis]AMD81069.1 hypothetical protein AXW82_00615 [Mycoplasmopsis canis PG 14]EIE39871.1 hypothetical protein MCANPG14_02356 [Mycoplasmopsis canis PG 14]VEU68883.1 Uncharacterised protein [Mycoplasmopsis canis]
MEKDFEKLNNDIINNINEIHDNVIYSQVTHEKEVERLMRWWHTLKITLIILSAIISSAVITSILGKTQISNIITVIIAALSLVFHSISYNFDLNSKISEHKKSADELRYIRDQIQILLAEQNIWDLEKIRNERILIIEKLNLIYSYAPKTSKKSYKLAKIALEKKRQQKLLQN